MNKVYLKTKDNIKTINTNLIIALLPLIFTGFYKNGIKLYISDLASIYGLFKPLIMDLIGLLCGITVSIVYSMIKHKKIRLFSDFYPLYGLLIASLASINTRMYIFSLVTIVFLFVSKLLNNTKINIVALTSLAIVLITKLIGNFTFLNLYEQKNTLTLNSMDYLIGRGSGGLNTTHILVLVISLIILSVNRYYKKEIPLYSTITYITCISIYLIATNNIDIILSNIFTNGILFSYIFIAPDYLTSSYTRRGKVIYGILIGLLTFALYLVYPELAALGSILIISILHNIIDKICKE